MRRPAAAWLVKDLKDYANDVADKAIRSITERIAAKVANGPTKTSSTCVATVRGDVMGGRLYIPPPHRRQAFTSSPGRIPPTYPSKPGTEQ